MSNEFNDNQRLVSYACAAVALDEGKNLYDSFLLLIEDVLRTIWIKDKPLSFQEVQRAVNDEYKVDIPRASLEDLLIRLRQKGIIEYRRIPRNSITLIKDEDRSSVKDALKGEVRGLFEDFRTFLYKRGIDISNEEAKDAMCQLIFKYSLEVSDFFSEPLSSRIDDLNGEYALELSDFLLECKANNSQNYIAAQRIYKGAVQASLLNISLDQTTALQDDPLPFEHIILDTNFILRILDLQSKHECSMAHETFNTLLTLGANFFVLKETLDEISNSIKWYLSITEGYTPQSSEYYRKIRLKPSGFDSAISEGNIFKAEMLLLSNKATLLEQLEGKGVTLLEEYSSCEESEKNITDLIEWKNRREGSNYRESQAMHDLQLIHCCREKRGNRPVKLSNAKWWVMTNDIQLAYWNQNHSDSKECVTEAQVSNILWIGQKKQDNSGLVSAIVAVAGRDRLSPSQLLTFNKRISSYLTKYKDNPDKCDKLAMVLASGKITMADISRMGNDEYDIDQTVEEKFGEIEKDKEKRRLDLELSRVETKKIELKLKKIETEDSLKKTEELLCKYKDVDNYKKNSAGKALGKRFAIGALILLVSTVAIIIGIPEIKYISKVFEEWFLGLIPTILSAIVLGSLWIYTAVKYGIPMLSFTKLFEHSKNRKVVKYAKNKGIELEEDAAYDNAYKQVKDDLQKNKHTITDVKKEINKTDAQIEQLKSQLGL